MLDIETLGTKAGCIVRELGIVVFTEDKIWNSYQYFFDIKSQEEKGLITEWDTAQWLLNNKNYYGPKDRENIVNVYKELRIGEVAPDLSDFFSSSFFDYTYLNKDTEIWANGTTFDIPILEHFFKTFGLESPFKYYYNIRDLRTVMRFLNFDKKSIPDEPFPHLAVSDCFWQVKALQAIYKEENSKFKPF